MNDLQIQQGTQFNGSQAAVELGKMLGLVAPITMSTDQQTLWLASALDALMDIIRPDEIKAVSMEVRRTVTRPSQIVPEIARLVSERRARQSRMREYEQPAIPGPPLRIPVMDRRGQPMSDEDTAELNAILEKVGATKRYRSDGTRYDAAQVDRSPEGGDHEDGRHSRERGREAMRP